MISEIKNNRKQRRQNSQECNGVYVTPRPHSLRVMDSAPSSSSEKKAGALCGTLTYAGEDPTKVGNHAKIL